jgi:hypothetical protein
LYLPVPAKEEERKIMAEFLANTILLSKSGRTITRHNRLEPDQTTKDDAALIQETSKDLAARFLELKWLFVMPGFTLMCGEIPAAWAYEKIHPEEGPANIQGVLFPLTQNYLLYLNLKEKGFYSNLDQTEEILTSNSPALLAATYGENCNTKLREMARYNNTKLYAPAGFHKKT